MRKVHDINHITPGLLLSVIEEFDAGKNTYVDEGDVRASVIGGSAIDYSDRILNVKQKNPPMIPKIGDVVVGYIDMLF